MRTGRHIVAPAWKYPRLDTVLGGCLGLAESEHVGERARGLLDETNITGFAGKWGKKSQAKPLEPIHFTAQANQTASEPNSKTE